MAARGEPWRRWPSPRWRYPSPWWCWPSPWRRWPWWGWAGTGRGARGGDGSWQIWLRGGERLRGSVACGFSRQIPSRGEVSPWRRDEFCSARGCRWRPASIGRSAATEIGVEEATTESAGKREEDRRRFCAVRRFSGMGEMTLGLFDPCGIGPGAGGISAKPAWLGSEARFELLYSAWLRPLIRMRWALLGWPDPTYKTTICVKF
jgi:hypothetical protein